MGGVWRNLPPGQTDTPPAPSCPLAAAELDARVAAVAEAAAVRATREGIAAYAREALPRHLKAISADPQAGGMIEDELLRKQCLEWAFQRLAAPAPHMNVVNAAQDLYDFIRNTPSRQDQIARQRRQANTGY